MAEKEVGKVENYFSKIGVAAVRVTAGELRVGDTIRISGATTDLTQTVESMQVEHQNVETAKEGDLVGLKVSDRVRPGDKVFLVTEE
ncbi:MAG: translation elongation factor-like protein [Deltaproteobacteria bacterium]|nr:MAG: translation elongation factor-like protein [Deltaproteobacteria bacterium]